MLSHRNPHMPHIFIFSVMPNIKTVTVTALDNKKEIRDFEGSL